MSEKEHTKPRRPKKVWMNQKSQAFLPSQNHARGRWLSTSETMFFATVSREAAPSAYSMSVLAELDPEESHSQRHTYP